VAAVVEVAAGRVPVMAGATSNDTSRAVDETERMCRLGADYILSATPYYNKPTQDGLYRHFMAVAEVATKPVCLYNVPGRTAVNLKPAVALRLAGHPNVMGIKEASGDLKQVMDLLQERPDGFTVLSGDDWLTLPIAFIVLVAVGCDYNLLLLSRYRDEIGAGIQTGLIRAMGSSGGVVITAAFVFAFTMLALLASDVKNIGQAGSAICLGLIFDMIIVRMFLVMPLARVLGTCAR